MPNKRLKHLPRQILPIIISKPKQNNTTQQLRLEPDYMSHKILPPFQRRIENYLSSVLPKPRQHYPNLSESMIYSVKNGGKRLRPTLVYTTAEMLGAPLHIVDTTAASVELVHCFSLVHDDLPAMDNSDYRRGKPSCHKVFGEDVAILAGDALLTLAFELLTKDDINPLSHNKRIKMIQLLCQATGSEGMVAGQVMDVNNDIKSNYDIKQLKLLHQLKTGALIKNSILMGALAVISPQHSHYLILEKVGELIGLLYQVCDDILDVTADEKTLGKQAGTDKELGKTTYVDILGLEQAKQYAKSLASEACSKLTKEFGSNNAGKLNDLTRYIYQRTI